MEEERQVKRAQRGSALRTPRTGGGKGARAGTRGTAPRISDVKARAKARLSKARSVIAQQKAAKGAKGVAAPTQQAVSAAAKAMKDFGFKAPKGMQMQISFVPKKQPAAGGGGGNNKGGRGGTNGRGGGNKGNTNRGRGGGGRGRGRR